MRRSLILLALMVVAASGQMIYGNWYCRSYDWSLELAEDGEYVSEFAEGRSVGRYFLDGYLITFQDAYTAEVATYTFEFAGDVLQLTEQMGTPYVFVRKGSPAENLPLDVIIEGPSYVSPALAEKEGFVLREDDTRTMFEVLELIVGGSVSEEEGEGLLDAWIAEFNENPAGFEEELGDLVAVRDEFYTASDPWRVGDLRQGFLADLYRASREVPETEQDAFTRAVYRHLKVLVFDDGLLLTDRDLGAHLDYAAFLVALSTGKPAACSQPQRDSVANRIVSEFPSLPLSRRQFICASQVIYACFSYAWDEADAAGRGLIAKGMLGEAAASNVDYGMLAPGVNIAAAVSKMDEPALAALAKVLALDHKTLMDAWVEGVQWPYYYELLP